MLVKHTVLPDGQPPTVAFTVLAHLCGPKANEMGWAPPYPPKMVRKETLTFFEIELGFGTKTLTKYEFAD